MAGHCILVVDDDQKIRGLLREVFEAGGFSVCEVDSAGDALEHLKSRSPVLITLDLQLGADNGLDVARGIRKTSQVPIVMVTGRDDVVDRVVGLEIGADDYITKPFHIREVLARVRSVLRRTKSDQATTGNEGAPANMSSSSAHMFDGMVIVPDRFELLDRDGKPCDLTSGDFKLLNIFLQNAKRVLSRDRLMDLTGGVEWSPLDRTIDNQVARLRKKIERNPADPKIIKTVRGVGYSFVSDVTPA